MEGFAMNEISAVRLNAPTGRSYVVAWDAIDALPLDTVLERLWLPEPDGEGWTASKGKRAIDEYRKFLKLNAKYPKNRIVPNRLMDVVWHLHILDTRKYADDCEEVFGKFLHHSPFFGLRGDVKVRDSAFDRTLDLYEIEFGANVFTEAKSTEGQQQRAAASDMPGRSGTLAAGCDAADIKAAGCDAADIKAAGCDAADIKAAGCDAADIKAAGCDAADIKAAGCDAADIKAASLDVRH
jgi:hypothetical protein